MHAKPYTLIYTYTRLLVFVTNPVNIAVEVNEFVLHGNTQKATAYSYTCINMNNFVVLRGPTAKKHNFMFCNSFLDI